MKKNVIAVAVAAALVAPVAMADVSISGGLQAEIASVGGDAASKNGIYLQDAMQGGTADSGNYGFIKFAASEDLGDGMKALAMANFNVNASDNAGMGARDSYVGLSAGWGTVLAGEMSSPYKSSTVGWDPLLATSLQARGNGGMYFGSSAKTLQGGYFANALAYANTFGTAKVVVAYVLDETAKTTAGSDSTVGNNALSASVNVPVGPVEVAVAYLNASKFADAAGTGANDKLVATKVGVKWVSGDISVAGQYESLDKGYSGNESGSVMYVTGSYTMGNNVVSASYGKTDKKVTASTDDTTYMAVALNHKFSKMTNAYVGYRATDAGSSNKETVFAGGLRVNF